MTPLRRYLTDKNVTQAELAKQLGVRQETISKWSLGTAQVPVKRVPRLSEVTGIPRIELRPDLPELFG